MLRRGDIIGRAVIVFDVKANPSGRKGATAAGRGASQGGSAAVQGSKAATGSGEQCRFVPGVEIQLRNRNQRTNGQLNQEIDDNEDR